jgi:hypothetical protein
METFELSRITQVHKDEDNLAIMFECGCTMVFTGVHAHPCIPEFIILEIHHSEVFDS